MTTLNNTSSALESHYISQNTATLCKDELLEVSVLLVGSVTLPVAASQVTQTQSGPLLLQTMNLIAKVTLISLTEVTALCRKSQHPMLRSRMLLEGLVPVPHILS